MKRTSQKSVKEIQYWGFLICCKNELQDTKI